VGVAVCVAVRAVAQVAVCVLVRVAACAAMCVACVLQCMLQCALHFICAVVCVAVRVNERVCGCMRGWLSVAMRRRVSECVCAIIECVHMPRLFCVEGHTHMP